MTNPIAPSSPIFATNAPKYLSAGFPVIPLYEREKRPVHNDWSRYAETPVERETAEEWLARSPNCNMGMVLGRQSGLIMIDIDTENELTFSALMKVLPFSPWHRLGRKGMMLAYKWSPIKTHRVKNISGQTIVECLSSRTQCVMPPSIHPDTMQPYTANSELLDVVDQLNFLPENIEELLRGAAKEAGENLSHSGWSKVTEYVSAGSRDTTMTEMAGLFAFAVVRGERTLREAIGMLHAYHAEYIESVSGDQVGVDKHIANLIKFLHRDVQDKGKILPKGWDDGYTTEDLARMGVLLGDADTEWDLEKIREYLQEQFELHTEGRARSEVVENVLKKVAKSNQLTRIDEDRVLKYIVDVSGMGLPVASYKARLRELRIGDVVGNDHSEIARAVLKDLEQYGLYRFHAENFMKWGGSHWVNVEKNEIRGRISRDYGHLDACKRSSDINGVLNVLSFVMEAGIQRVEVKGINFSNGFLTQELKLVPHDPDYGMTYTLPFRYMAEEAAKFPLFAEFLFRSWGRDSDYQAKMDALQEAICVTLFGLGSKYQRAILVHGAPKSGKTQLLRIVESMVPVEAKCSVPPDEWADKFLPTQLHNKILNVCGELSDKKRIDGQKFKDIIDGSTMNGQHKNQQIFKFAPMLTHWFASNHIPKSEDTSHGFIRRWLILTFNFPVEDGEVVVDVGDFIASQEKEPICAWAVQAMSRLMARNGYTLPESHKHLSDEFANVNNSVRYFIKESGKTRVGVEGLVSEVKLYNSYMAFCLGPGGTKPVGSVRFRAMMRELTTELGFRLKMNQGAAGGTEAIFEGLTLLGA